MFKNYLLLLLLGALPCMASLHAQQSFEIWFEAGAIRYHAILLARPDSPNWWMRVKYSDPDCRCVRLIEEKMLVEKTVTGIRVSGSNVKDVNKNKYINDYSADNFYIFYDDNGKVHIKNIDNQGVVSKANIALIDGAVIVEKLKAFGW